MDDKEFETYHSGEQFGEYDFEPMIAPQLLAEKRRREYRAAPFGVGLEVPDPLAVGAGRTQQPQR